MAGDTLLPYAHRGATTEPRGTKQALGRTSSKLVFDLLTNSELERDSRDSARRSPEGLRGAWIARGEGGVAMRGRAPGAEKSRARGRKSLVGHCGWVGGRNRGAQVSRAIPGAETDFLTLAARYAAVRSVRCWLARLG